MWIRKRHKQDSAPDEMLVRRFVDDGDQASLGLLFDRYLELIYGVCMKYLRDVHSASDATIEVYEILFRKLPGQEVREFRPWLYVLVKNHCLGILRKENTRNRQLNGVDVMQSGQVKHPVDDDELKWQLLQEESLHDCLGKLPELQQRAIELFYFEKQTYEQIADSLNVPLERIRSYMQNGRRNLKICMEKKHGISKI